MFPVARAKAIILNPKQEWPVIEAEPATPASIYRSYVIPLAAIPALAGFIGGSVIGYGFFGGSYRVPIVTGLTAAIVQFVMSLVTTWLLAMIIDALAPTFGGTRNQIQALKVAAYSYTAAWLAGIFALLPGLRILGILGLYSLYLLYLGIPPLMRAPEDRTPGYVAAAVISALVLFFVLQWVAAFVLPGARFY